MGAAQKARAEIPYILGYAALDFSGNLLDSFGEGVEISPVVERSREIVSSYLQMYRELGEYSVGLPKEVLMSTTEIFVLIRIFYNEELYQVAVLKREGNLGYTRYALQRLVKELKK